MQEISLPVDDAYDVLDAFGAGIDLALAVDSLSVLARLERGAWLIDRRLFPDLPEESG